MLNSLLHGLLSLHGWPAYLIPAALCFGEAAIFLGFVIPGEIGVVYGGVLASEHHVSLVLMLVLVVIAAVLGDLTGYLIGRFFGPALLRHRPLKNSKGVEKTRDFLQRRGGPAVFLGRFVSVFRALMPGMAGVSGLPFPTFLLFNALGGIIWGIGFTFVGFLAGKSYERVLKVVGRASTGLVIGVVVIVVGVAVFRHLRHRKEGSSGKGEKK
ncbi:MAG: DedA family protein [Acidimicrobiales bacterium]